MKLSASAIERLHNCPTSAVLPAVYVTGDAAEQGTDNHAVVETAARNYRDHGVIPDGPLGELLRGCTVLAIERALVVDVVTQRVRDLGEGVGRAYGELGPTEVACTVDIVIRHADDSVSVYDWKSRSRVTSAARNWQVKVQALAVLGWLSEQAVQAGLVYLDDWQADVAEFDALDCAAIASELMELRERLTRAKAEDPVHLGRWCDYCPAQFGCPGRLAIARAGVLAAVAQGLDALSDEQAGEVWTQLNAAADIVDAARDVIKARAKRSPVPLPNGKRLALVEAERNSVDNKKAAQLLESQGIPVPMKVSRYTQLREVK